MSRESNVAAESLGWQQRGSHAHVTCCSEGLAVVAAAVRHHTCTFGQGDDFACVDGVR